MLRLCSPTLPVGAFAYSGGLEWAVEAGWVHDEPSCASWLESWLNGQLARLELPVMFRQIEARIDRDRGAWDHWEDRLKAFRETEELLAQDEHHGHALRKLLRDLAVPGVDGWLSPEPSAVSAFAFAAVAWDIPAPAAALGFAWGQLEAQVQAAIRLVPLGQTAGQRLLGRLVGGLPEQVRAARRWPDHAVGSSLPGLAIASSRHRWQYCRLFRS